MSCQGTLLMLLYARAMMTSNSSKCNRQCRCLRDSQLVSSNSKVWNLQNLSLPSMKNPTRCLKLCPQPTSTRIISSNNNNLSRPSKNRQVMHLATSGAWLTSTARNVKCKKTARHRFRWILTQQLFLLRSVCWANCSCVRVMLGSSKDVVLNSHLVISVTLPTECVTSWLNRGLKMTLSSLNKVTLN